MKSFLTRFVFRLAKSRLAGRIVRWSFTHMTAWMPLEKLYETQRVIAFYHPRPSYPVHILIIPKHPLRSLMELSTKDIELMAEIIGAAQEVVRRLRLEEKGYRLIVNGGDYQEVEQLHFHLVSNK